MRKPHVWSLLAWCCALVPGALAAAVPTPESVLGRRPGEDRYLAAWPEVVAYLGAVDAASDRVSIESAGRSTQGNDLPVVVVTSAANQARLERYREIARRLAQPDDLEPEAARALVEEGRVIVLVTCSIHSTEVGSTQMAMELVHELATADDPVTRRILDEVVLLLMPSINPDGQVMVVDWYRKWLGTEYEAGPLPWLYHPYVGHDNNRDFYMLTQKESQAVNDLLYHRWFPQVFLDEHQMGALGPRMFVPPQTDPLAPEVDSLVFRQADLLGTAMGLRLEEAGKTGVGHDMIYDSYWPGGTRNTAWWKNVTGLLTEVASARLASPLWVEPGELEGGEKGLPEYVRRSNFPSPWPGGWWRLRDVMDYEKIATRALLETAALHRRGFLANLYTMARGAIARGRSGPPYAWVVPPDQHDPAAAARLVELLLRHGVRAHHAPAGFVAGRHAVPAGSTVILAAQPYRSFLLTMLRPQRYPEVLPYVGGPVIPPYDVTSWSLPIAMGVEVVELQEPVTAALEPLRQPARPAAVVEPGAGGYLVAHAADTAPILLNRLLRDGRTAYWLAEPPAGIPPGEIYLPPEALDAAALGRLASELHLTVRPLAAPPAGRAYRVRPVRVGLYKPWVASMDEGWTRWLLERYEFSHQSLDNAAMRTGSYRDAVDVVLLPDVPPAFLKTGEPAEAAARRQRSPLPPPYAGGIDTAEAGKGRAAGIPAGEGSRKLAAWVRGGGTVVALDSAGDYLIELFGLPLRNVLDGVKEESFRCPGSMLRVLVDTAHPLGYGLRAEEAAYFADSPAFATQPTDARFERRVVVRYPDDAKDILVSGYLEGGKLLERRAAVVELAIGKGRVILLGFRAQHRAQPHRTFKLLWNAIYRARLEESTLGPG